MTLWKRSVVRCAVVLGIVTFFVMSATMIPHMGMSMAMGGDGTMQMTPCSMPGMTTLCTMNPLTHITEWQEMFVALPLNIFAFAFLLFGISVAVVFSWTWQEHFSLKIQRGSRLLVRRNEQPDVSSPLQELFSNGILNPKLF